MPLSTRHRSLHRSRKASLESAGRHRKRPDGVRAANGNLLLAANGSGKISVFTVSGDRAGVAVSMKGLKTPTAAGTIWIAARRAGNAVSIPIPG